MILKITAVGLISAIAWLHGANGASYSKVFVQNGGLDVVPVEYYNYGAPAVISNPEISRLTAPPVGSVLPVQTVSNVIPPCVSPCVVTAPAVATAVPSAKLVSYNSPNVPVVLAPSNDKGYEYSYVVYDETTGDRKAQRELSDGAVVLGEYSFLQPDGYVREVQYRADDLNGFNVVVKNILPEAVGGNKKTENPCTIKHEELKVEPSPNKDAQDSGPEDIGHSNQDNNHTHEGHVHYHDHPEPSTNVNEVEAPTHEAVKEEKQIIVHDPEKESVQEHENVKVLEPEQQTSAKPELVEPKPENKTPELVTEARVEQVEMQNVTPPVTNQAKVEVVDLPLEKPIPNLMISYEEVLRCLQAKGLAEKGLNFSPLTYIILPASSRPC